MGWFRTKSTASDKPEYTGLQLQTATTTLPVPIIWGANKSSVNILWYNNFQYHPAGGGGGKGGKGFFRANTPGQDYYTADVILALCEGEIQGIGTVWRDQSIFTLAELNLTLFLGATPQAVWPYLAANYPAQAIAYQGTAYVCASNYDLGASAVISNHNFEIYGRRYQSGFNNWDADPAGCIYDFLFNAQFGLGFSPSSVDLTTLFGASGDASLQTYCAAVGIAISPVLSSQEQASSILTRWLQICNSAAVWSAGKLKFVSYGDTPIVAGTVVTTTTQVSIPQPLQNSSGVYASAEITVCSAADFITDGGVVLAISGAAFTLVGTTPGPGEYFQSGGSYYFNNNNAGNVIAITYTYQLPYSFTPNLTPVYNLTDDDFADAGKDTDPVQVSILDPYELPTIQRIEICDRNNQYDLTPVEARDQSQIDLYGPRVGSTITAHEITDPYQVGPVVAQLQLQRALYVRKNYHFKLGWEYCRLDPMDIVAISDAGLALSNVPVRITSIEEDDTGTFTVIAEELVAGVSTAVLYETQPVGGGGGIVNRNLVPGLVVSTPPPLIYEVPSTITGPGNPELWFGASGGPNWGGANVWVSLDGSSYTVLATITSPMITGTLTANLAAASGYDTTNTLAVDLTVSRGALAPATAQIAQQGATLCLVDQELLAFANATLTSTYHYNLTGLARGLYGTLGDFHSSGADFYRVDNNVIAVQIPANYIGVLLYFKFQSFNTFGGSLEDLASLPVYTYTPTGTGFSHPIIAQLATFMALDLGHVPDTLTVTDDLGVVGSIVTGSLDLGSL